MSAEADREGKALLARIRTTFPEVAERLDGWIREEDCWADDPSGPWALLIEQFSQATTDAIARRDETTASRHLQFMEQELAGATDDLRDIIDVQYAESLMWNVSDAATKAWGWSLVPDGIRHLYLRMWGSPPDQRPTCSGPPGSERAAGRRITRTSSR